MSATDLPAFTLLPNLAEARLGAAILACTDDFFAAAPRLLDHVPPAFIPDKYDDNGKWMDGWESRRKRGPGQDSCVIRLAAPTLIAGLDLDTTGFTGNFPLAAGLEAWAGAGDPGPEAAWAPLLPPQPMRGNSRHFFSPAAPEPVTHLRLTLFPDGGIARLRVHGRVVPAAATGLVDLASVLQGARVLDVSDRHYRAPGQMLLPGRGANMGEGWETRRRRSPGFDWAIIALARRGRISALELDTAYHRGNYPHQCAVWATDAPGLPDAAAPADAIWWPALLAPTAMRPDHLHRYQAELLAAGPFTHLRLDVIPDGGIHRIRAWGEAV